MTRPTRRRLLGVAGAASVGAVAGCLGGDEPDEGTSDGSDGEDGTDGNTTDGEGSGDGDDSGDDDGSDESPEPAGTVLGDISIHNLHEQEHELSVMVEIGGETRTWPEPILEAGPSTTTLEREWPDSGEPFMVRVRMDGGQFRDVRPDQWNDPACVNLVVVIDASGSLNVAGDTTGGYCAE
ncbi:hypothetical protein [Halovivax limisalsi]|uniref:hypothetical protein n=1 Tax=Halovivax limisalsi TaxID=1453760 RepID=UPI001FFD1867|nr:hypothetical protein [Halovivax limisalsi]